MATATPARPLSGVRRLEVLVLLASLCAPAAGIDFGRSVGPGTWLAAAGRSVLERGDGDLHDVALEMIFCVLPGDSISRSRVAGLIQARRWSGPGPGDPGPVLFLYRVGPETGAWSWALDPGPYYEPLLDWGSVLPLDVPDRLAPGEESVRRERAPPSRGSLVRRRYRCADASDSSAALLLLRRPEQAYPIRIQEEGLVLEIFEEEADWSFTASGQLDDARSAGFFRQREFPGAAQETRRTSRLSFDPPRLLQEEMLVRLACQWDAIEAAGGSGDREDPGGTWFRIQEFLAACGGGPLDGGLPRLRRRLETEADEARGADSLAVRIGRPAPEFALRTRDGSTRSVAGWRGKVVLLGFVGSQDPSCLQVLRLLHELRSASDATDVEVVAVSAWKDDGSRLESLLKAERLDLPVLMDGGDVARERYRVPGVPFLYLLDREGRILDMRRGVGDMDRGDYLRLFASQSARRGNGG